MWAVPTGYTLTYGKSSVDLLHLFVTFIIFLLRFLLLQHYRFIYCEKAKSALKYVVQKTNQDNLLGPLWPKIGIFQVLLTELTNIYQMRPE